MSVVICVVSCVAGDRLFERVESGDSAGMAGTAAQSASRLGGNSRRCRRELAEPEEAEPAAGRTRAARPTVTAARCGRPGPEIRTLPSRQSERLVGFARFLKKKKPVFWFVFSFGSRAPLITPMKYHRAPLPFFRTRSTTGESYRVLRRLRRDDPHTFLACTIGREEGKMRAEEMPPRARPFRRP